MNKNIEILAPAGSYDCLVAALKSGADAIYVGGNRFGARANATNFSLDELKKAIDFVHLHGKQIYLTINTLLKEDELSTELYEYLLPLYDHGIDAVIVQDLGVLQFVKEQFPDLPIHASTQMTVTNLLGARFLEQQGVERVVTSRELSIKEVEAIAKNSDLEIESFVHGALCYSYSGQCLYSSMIGGRSGNRGQCAQPCRLPYTIEGKTDYFMSLKDICTIQDIPDLIEAGVYSFKIEGRMKKPEYVASVTSMYRKYVDLYLEHGRAGYDVLEDDINDLGDIFNRGDFHGGYWKHYNGSEMITHGRPNHTGLPVIRVVKQEGRMVTGVVIRNLHKGDILEISNNGDNYTLGKEYFENDFIELSLRKGVSLHKNSLIYRTRNQWIIDSLYHDLEENKFQQPVNATLILMVGSNASLHLQLGDTYVSVESSVVQVAQKAPATEEKILQQLNKTGNTPFYFNEIELVLDDGIFVPNQQLNQLRRDALEILEQTIVSEYRRVKNTQQILKENFEQPEVKLKSKILKNHELQKIPMYVYVETLAQLEEVADESIFEAVYIDSNIINSKSSNKKLWIMINRIHESGRKSYFAFPHIFRNQTVEYFQEIFSCIQKFEFDGMIVRNLESIEFLKEQDYSGEIILDHHVYIYNNKAREFWIKQGVTRMTNGLELTAQELKRIDQEAMELIIYGYTPTMISAQCIKKTTGQCNHQSEILKIKDRINKDIFVKSCCDYCYNIVYNTCPTSLLDEQNEILAIQPSVLRVNFTIEDTIETKRVIDSLKHFYYDKCIDTNIVTECEVTKGHFRRGIR